MASFAQVAWRFDHTRSLSVVGYSSVMRTLLGGAAANLIVRNVSYTPVLNARGSSPCFGGSTYAISMTYIASILALESA